MLFLYRNHTAARPEQPVQVAMTGTLYLFYFNNSLFSIQVLVYADFPFFPIDFDFPIIKFGNLNIAVRPILSSNCKLIF